MGFNPLRIIEPVSRRWIRVQGKAQADSKSEHTREHVSILNRFVERLNVHDSRCEIPPAPAGATLPWTLRRIFEAGSSLPSGPYSHHK
jgi:hypothetical protein